MQRWYSIKVYIPGEDNTPGSTTIFSRCAESEEDAMKQAAIDHPDVTPIKAWLEEE